MLCCPDSSQCSVNISGQRAEAVVVRRTNCHKCHIELLQTTLKQKRYFAEEYRNEVTAALVDSLTTVVSNKDGIRPKNICQRNNYNDAEITDNKLILSGLVNRFCKTRTVCLILGKNPQTNYTTLSVN